MAHVRICLFFQPSRLFQTVIDSDTINDVTHIAWGTISKWDMRQSTSMGILKGHLSVLSIQLSGNRLVSGGREKTVRGFSIDAHLHFSSHLFRHKSLSLFLSFSFWVQEPHLLISSFAVWDLSMPDNDSRACQHVWSHSHSVTALQFDEEQLR